MPWARARDVARDLGERCPAAAERDLLLADALGATLSADLTALVGIPSYDASAMDGYAVAGPGPWTVVGRVLAGSTPTVATLGPGEAAEIATGAQVPKGTESVLPYEAATVDRVRVSDGGRDTDGDRVTDRDPATDGDRVSGDIAPGRHVRWAGEDTAPGATVVPAGTPVTPPVLGLAASLGHDTLRCRRPLLAAIVTGDEIARSGRPAPGTVRDAIGPVLPGLAAWAGATVSAPEHTGDTLADMVTALRDAAARPGVGAIAVCGASSRGPADHLRAALAELGATVVVDGVACRPGHPQLLAHLGPAERPGPVVAGLPGNPNAALAAALTLLVPVLSAQAGRADPTAAAPRELRLRGDAHPHPHDTRLVAVRVTGTEVEPVGHDRPGSLRGASLADGYAVIPPNWSGPTASMLWLPH